jgi:glutamyl-tRNA synthetase
VPAGNVDAPAAPPWDPAAYDPEAFGAMAPLVQERVQTFAEVPGYVAFLFAEPFAIDEGAWTKVMGKEGPVALAQLQRCVAALGALDAGDWDAAAIEAVVFDVAPDSGLVRDDGQPNRKRAQAPVRVAALGSAVGPPLWESLQVLGQQATVARLEAAVSRLAAALEAESGGGPEATD